MHPSANSLTSAALQVCQIMEKLVACETSSIVEDACNVLPHSASLEKASFGAVFLILAAEVSCYILVLYLSPSCNPQHQRAQLRWTHVGVP